MKSIFTIRIATALGSAAALLAVSACGDSDRQAEAEAPGSEAEVAAELPGTAASTEEPQGVAQQEMDVAEPMHAEEVASQTEPSRPPAGRSADRTAKGAEPSPGVAESTAPADEEDDNPMLGMRAFD